MKWLRCGPSLPSMFLMSAFLSAGPCQAGAAPLQEIGSPETATIRATVVDDRTGLPIKRVQLTIDDEAVDSAIADLTRSAPQAPAPQASAPQASAPPAPAPQERSGPQPAAPQRSWRDLGDGVFALSVSPGLKAIVASAIGYAVVKVTVDAQVEQTTDVTIRLSEGPGAYTEHVDVVGVSGHSDSNAPAGSMTLFGRDLQNLRGAILDDPLRAVQSMPAVSATDDLYAEFSVRGSGFRHINVTVDGIPTKYLMHTVNDVVDGGSVTMINSETLGAVTLLPGSYPQKAGRYMGPEVDMRTRDGDRDRFRGRAGLSGTSASFLGEGPLPNARGSWLASVRRSYLDYLIKQIDPNAGLAFGFVDAQAKVKYDVTSHHTLEVMTLFGRAAFDGDDYDDLNDTASARSRSWLSTLSWRYVSSTRLALTNRAYTTGVNFDNDNPFGEQIDAARFNEIGWRIDGTFAAAARTIVEFGGDAQAMSGRHTRRVALPMGTSLITAGNYDADATAASAYAQAVFSWPRLTVTAGVRADRWSLTETTTGSPWLNVSVKPWERTTIKFGTGIFRQFAEFDQIYGLNGGGIGLKPEEARHLDIGVEQRLSGPVTLLVTGFARRESDVLWIPGSETRMVNNRIVGASFAAKWANALSGDARGGEVVLRRDSPTGWSGWAGYAYARMQYDRPAGSESFWANADQRHTLALYAHYPLTSRTSLSTRYRYGSNFPITGYLTTAATSPMNPETNGPTFYQLTSVRNTARLPAYSRLDVRGEHAFLWNSRRLVLFVEVANVQDRKNLRNTPYSIDRNGRAFGVTETTMPIIPSAGFVVEF